DVERVGTWGASRGGMMSYLAARQAPELGYGFKALVAEATPTDMVAEYKLRPDMERVFSTWIPGFDENPEEVLAARSALLWAEALPEDLPILIQHGAKDQRVSVDSARKMAARLEELGRPHKLMIYEEGGHNLRGQLDMEAREAVIEWFKQYLGEAANCSSDREACQ
ncbi:MAG: prolyl oligopeptidase family serine peptidase, partial [Gammaproteobacteria bacterium]|nr:prolyl oligopeptidase family serine peptidase [Gammaproteobacteria bacterium]